jgi:hypothetical protein
VSTFPLVVWETFALVSNLRILSKVNAGSDPPAQLTAEERQQLDVIAQSDHELTEPRSRVVHLPLFLLTATKP